MGDLESSLWPMLVQTLMDLNFSSARPRLPGWMENTLFSDKLTHHLWLLLRKWRLLDHNLERPPKRSRSLLLVNYKQTLTVHCNIFYLEFCNFYFDGYNLGMLKKHCTDLY